MGFSTKRFSNWKLAFIQHKRAPLPRKGAHHLYYNALYHLKSAYLQSKNNNAEYSIEKETIHSINLSHLSNTKKQKLKHFAQIV